MRDSDLRARPRAARSRGHGFRPVDVCDRPRCKRGRCGCGVHRRRHTFPPRRWACGSKLCARGGARDSPASEGLHRDHHEIDGARWNRRRGRAYPAADFAVASNPEFLREGAAIRDFRHPDRIVVGTEDERARKVAGDIYRPLYLNQAPIMYTKRRTAELIKYAANAFLATKITFINEMADLAEQVGANVQEIARGIGLDNRIGTKFLHAGAGYGGSCFPKDTRALAKTALDYGVQLRIVEATLTANDNRKRAMARKVANVLGGDIRGKTIGVLGLTFKPDTDDMREAPSIPLIAGLLDFGAKVNAYDPAGMGQAKKELSGIEYCDDAYACARGTDAMVIVTDWRQFRALDLERIKVSMIEPVIIDLRNIYRPEDMSALGFKYESIGRPN